MRKKQTSNTKPHRPKKRVWLFSFIYVYYTDLGFERSLTIQKKGLSTVSSTTDTPKALEPGSQDLSGIASGKLRITIQQEGKEDWKYTLESSYTEKTTYADLLRLVLHTRQEQPLEEWDPEKCPCAVVSFDPEENELTVKMLPLPSEPPAQHPAS